ncbi:MAG: type II toxin-antitoxin system VapC family toxin, partial [Sulfurovum sp.]
MNNKLLLDTNIIIYYFNGIITDSKIDQILKESFNISIITKIEFLSWQ